MLPHVFALCLIVSFCGFLPQFHLFCPMSALTSVRLWIFSLGKVKRAEKKLYFAEIAWLKEIQKKGFFKHLENRKCFNGLDLRSMHQAHHRTLLWHCLVIQSSTSKKSRIGFMVYYAKAVNLMQKKWKWSWKLSKS